MWPCCLCVLSPTLTWVWSEPFFLLGGKTQVWEERDKHEKISAWTWALVLKPAWATWEAGPILTSSEPWHSQPWILMVCQSVNSDSTGTDGCSILAFLRELSLPASCGNTVGSLLCHLSADFEVNSDPRRPHGRVPAWLLRFCNRSWNLCCGKSSSCTSLLA